QQLGIRDADHHVLAAPVVAQDALDLDPVAAHTLAPYHRQDFGRTRAYLGGEPHRDGLRLHGVIEIAGQAAHDPVGRVAFDGAYGGGVRRKGADLFAGPALAAPVDIQHRGLDDLTPADIDQLARLTVDHRVAQGAEGAAAGMEEGQGADARRRIAN